MAKADSSELDRLRAEADAIRASLKPSLLFWRDTPFLELPPLSVPLTQRFLVSELGVLSVPLLVIIGAAAVSLLKHGPSFDAIALVIWALFSMVLVFWLMIRAMLAVGNNRRHSSLANVAVYLLLTLGPYMLSVATILRGVGALLDGLTLWNVGRALVWWWLGIAAMRETRVIQEFLWAVERQLP